MAALTRRQISSRQPTQDSLMRCTSKSKAELIAGAVQEDTMLVIFESNQVQRAGENLDQTRRLCEATVHGEEVDVRPRETEYGEVSRDVSPMRLPARCLRPSNPPSKSIPTSEKERTSTAAMQVARLCDLTGRKRR